MKKNLFFLKIILVITICLSASANTFSQVNKNPQSPPGQTPPPTPPSIVPESEPMKPVQPIPSKPDPPIPPKQATPNPLQPDQPLRRDTIRTRDTFPAKPVPASGKSTGNQKKSLTGNDKAVGKDKLGHTLYSDPTGKTYYIDNDGVKIYVDVK